MKRLLKTSTPVSPRKIFLLSPPPDGEGFYEGSFPLRSRMGPDFVSLGSEHEAVLSEENLRIVRHITSRYVNASALKDIFSTSELSLLPQHIINRLIAEAMKISGVRLPENDRRALVAGFKGEPVQAMRTFVSDISDQTQMSNYFAALSAAMILKKISE